MLSCIRIWSLKVFIGFPKVGLSSFCGTAVCTDLLLEHAACLGCWSVNMLNNLTYVSFTSPVSDFNAVASWCTEEVCAGFLALSIIKT